MWPDSGPIQGNVVLYVVDYAGVAQNAGTGGKVIGLINPHAEADTVTLYDGKATSTGYPSGVSLFF